MTTREIIGLVPLRPTIRTTPWGYQGCVGNGGRGKTKLFPLSPQGRELAEQWSLAQKQKQRLRQKCVLSSKAEMPGVYLYGGSWHARAPTWWKPYLCKGFSVAKYGARAARKMARDVALANWMKEATT